LLDNETTSQPGPPDHSPPTITNPWNQSS